MWAVSDGRPYRDRVYTASVQIGTQVQGILLSALFAFVHSTILPTVAFAGDSAYKVVYDRGPVAATRAGTDLKMYIEVNQIRAG
jgi:hypothetical protein